MEEYFLSSLAMAEFMMSWLKSLSIAWDSIVGEVDLIFLGFLEFGENFLG